MSVCHLCVICVSMSLYGLESACPCLVRVLVLACVDKELYVETFKESSVANSTLQ